jgi:hypothetical protein
VPQSCLLSCERQAPRGGGSIVNQRAELSIGLQLCHSWLLVLFVDQGVVWVLYACGVGWVRHLLCCSVSYCRSRRLLHQVARRPKHVHALRCMLTVDGLGAASGHQGRPVQPNEPVIDS